MGERLDVRAVALGRWRSILLAMGMDERALSGRHVPCPMCGGKDRFRFDDKEGRGTYYCSGCGPGDGVALAMGVTGLSFPDAAREIERLAGVARPSAPRPARSDEDKLAALKRTWCESAPIAPGDEAARYLVGRGLALTRLPGALRLHPAMPYYEGGKRVGTFPAMLAAVTAPSGRPVSIHRTYLQNARKAPVAAPKKLMQGLDLEGAAIRLAGRFGALLGISEGIETALAASELFDVPVWSCISTSGIESFEPPEGVERVVVFADNDANFAGQAAAYRAAHRLTTKGLKVEVRIPPQRGDWLDVLTSAGAS